MAERNCRIRAEEDESVLGVTWARPMPTECAARTQLHLVGYLNCRVFIEGLRHTGSAPTPDSLRGALHKLRVDLGGYLVDFAGGNVGSRYVDIGVVTRDGRLQY